MPMDGVCPRRCISWQKGHVFSQDVYKGTFFNDAGKGFLHESSWVCPASPNSSKARALPVVIVSSQTKTTTRCFSCGRGRSTRQQEFSGDYQWTSGTGKYTGIAGNNTFRATRIGATPEVVDCSRVSCLRTCRTVFLSSVT